MATAEELYLRTEFLERIAHELIGSAGVTLGALHEVERALGDDFTPHERLFVMARRGARRILRIAEHLRQTAELEAATVEFARTSVEIGQLVEDAVEDARNIESRRNVRTDVRLPAEPCRCSIDPQWMRAVVAEITANAIRHARASAVVCVERRARDVCITASDDGSAIGPLEPLRFQAPSQRRGLGLGLAIARDVVLAHRGRLEIELDGEGEPHTGTHVRLVLPLEP